jgi:hypothetical protein
MNLTSEIDLWYKVSSTAQEIIKPDEYFKLVDRIRKFFSSPSFNQANLTALGQVIPEKLRPIAVKVGTEDVIAEQKALEDLIEKSLRETQQ